MSATAIADRFAGMARASETLVGRIRLLRPEAERSSGVAQARIVRVLDTIASRHTAGTVILASHGNLIALALNAFMPNVDYAFWESIPMPAVFTLIRDGSRWRSISDDQEPR